MTPLTEKEIQVALSVILDAPTLSEDPRTQTNAQFKNNGYDRSFKGQHPFLVLHHFDTERWLLLPLSSEYHEYRGKLNPEYKLGNLPQWRDVDSYFSPWQHWLAPVSAILDAAFADLSDENDRCTYQPPDMKEFHGLASPIVRNRTPFHRPSPEP